VWTSVNEKVGERSLLVAELSALQRVDCLATSRLTCVQHTTGILYATATKAGTARESLISTKFAHGQNITLGVNVTVSSHNVDYEVKTNLG